MRTFFLDQPRWVKQSLVAALDAVLCVLAVWIAFTVRLEMFHQPSRGQVLAYLIAPFLAMVVFIPLGLYRAVFRYTGMAAMQAIAWGVAWFTVLYAMALFGLMYLGWVAEVPRSLPIIVFFVLLGLVGASRAMARFWLNEISTRKQPGLRTQRILIYGAGSSGVQTARAMAHAPEYRIMGFVDDATSLQGRSINGVRVYAPSELEAATRNFAVETIVLAMPSITRHRRNAILQSLRGLPLRVLTLPGLGDLTSGRFQPSDVRELDIDDLLGRDPVTPTAELMVRNNAGKTVLVTGAGGSIGSELCRQILKIGPDRLLLVESSEYALYAVDGELKSLLKASVNPHAEVIPLLASVRDKERMRKLFATWRPHTVYHAAAYKHVPLVEHNPAEGIANNVFGTLQTAELAAQHGVDDFVLISTDKAVRPTNIMGASKRLAELVLQALAHRGEADAGHRTRFSMVRFGNVLGSSGSVVPRFRQQIHAGGPITLTHADITRYFMTIPEAAQLVIQAGAMGHGGDVFVLDMGQPVRIIDLARRMVELSGLTIKTPENPDGDIAVSVTGLRPGEKLYEELLIGENPQLTDHPRIMRAREDFLPWPELHPLLANMQQAIEQNDVEAMRALLQQVVSGYVPMEGVVDWLKLEEERPHRALVGA